MEASLWFTVLMVQESFAPVEEGCQARQASGIGGEPFDDRMKRPAAAMREQQAGGARFDAAMDGNLDALGFAIGRRGMAKSGQASGRA